MTTLQVETKVFPTSIPNTISRDPVSPSSQFLSFYSASEGLRKAESISSPDESGGREGTRPASSLFEEEKLASLRGASILAAAAEAWKWDSKRVAAATRRSNAKPARQNNFTKPISLEDVRRGYVDDPLDSFERAEIDPFTGRPVRENSDQSIEEVKIPRTYLRQPLDRAEYEANERRFRQPEGDSSSEDDGPIILRNRRPENRFPSYDPPPSPPALRGRRERWSRIRSPHHRSKDFALE